MQQSCQTCGATFTLGKREVELYASFDQVPISLCFTCLQKHHLSFRNGRNLYSRTCDLTGEKIITNYAPEKPYKVYKRDEWYGDRWSANEFGRDFNFDRTFFEQYKELQLDVPRCALLNINPENSDYCNMCTDNKNCYLVFGGDYNEDSLYCSMNMRNRNLVDSDYSNRNELCYWLMNSHDCYGTRFAFDSSNCSNCAFISNCTGCSDCILCTNLANKTHCIRNEQLSKDAYLEQKEELLGGYAQQQKLFHEHVEQRKKRIVKSHYVLASEHCTGDYITHSKGCENCYLTWDSEDLVNVLLADHQKDSLNCSYVGGAGGGRCFNQVATINGSECSCSFFTSDTYHAEYSEITSQCKYIFGCIGLQHKEYCIFNKQYTRDEFFALRTKIIKHMKKTEEWGNFFPKELSCFAYNESTASEYYPLSKKSALEEGFSWREEKQQVSSATKIIPAEKLPDSIDEIPDDILNWAVICERSGKPFRLVKQELEFYRQMHLPVPHLEPNERFAERMKFMNPFHLHTSKCTKCEKEIQTTYAPQRPEIVYCEECYLKEVY